MYETVGLASLIVAVAFFMFMAVVIALIINAINSSERKQKRYDLFELTLLNEFAKKKGFDLTIEEAKDRITSDKTFRKRIQEELLKEFIENQDKNKKEEKK